MTTGTLDRGVTITVLIAIVAMATTIVHREFKTSSDAGPPPAPPTYVEGWRKYLASGTIESGHGSRVSLIEFGDLQCPACRDYQAVIRAIGKRFDKDINVVFVHFPMPYHKFAQPAARASQCANLQHRFGPFVDAVYAKQESLKVRPLSDYARDARVPDAAAFVDCLGDSAHTAPIVELGIKAAEEAHVPATPTVIVNGWQFDAAPAEKYLRESIQHQLDSPQTRP
jgi:protein-disulfide isomerase